MDCWQRIGQPGRISSACGSRQQGYVLLFALGLLAVVSTLVLGVSVGLRLDAQLLAREKEQLQEHYALQGAVQYAMAQAAISLAVAALPPDPRHDALRQSARWQFSPTPYQVTVGQQRIEVLLQDGSGLPDANTLTAAEWQRLFVLLGAASPEAAQTLASRVLAFKQELARMRGGAGFASLQELLDWPDIPRQMLSGGSGVEAQGLQDWLVVGTGQKKVHPYATPLPLFKVLGQANDEQLQQLTQWRRAGAVPAAQFQAWVQAAGLTASTPDSPVLLLRARVQRARPVLGSNTLVATVAKKAAALELLDQWTLRSVPLALSSTDR